MVSFLNLSGYCCFFREIAVCEVFGSQCICKLNRNRGEQESYSAYWIVKM